MKLFGTKEGVALQEALVLESDQQAAWSTLLVPFLTNMSTQLGRCSGLFLGEKFVASVENSGNKQNQLNCSLNVLIKGKL